MDLEPKDLAALKEGKRALLPGLRRNPDCTAVGYGFRRRAGRVTGEPVIVVSVAEKRPRDRVAPGSLVPSSVTTRGGPYGVDVIQAGRFSLRGADGRSAAAAVIPERMRPIRQGCLITNSDTEAGGSFGCLVHDRIDNVLCVLTAANAVGALLGAAPGNAIGNPGLPPLGGWGVGTLRRFTPLFKDRVNRVHAAVIEISENVPVSRGVAQNLMPPISPGHRILGLTFATASDGSALFMRIGNVLQELNVQLFHCPGDEVIAAPRFGMNVEKVGWMSGHTSRRIVAMGATPVGLGLQGDDYYDFDDLVQVDSGFTELGDAGAAVLAGGNGGAP